MSVVSASEARKRLNRLLDEVSKSHEPVHISGKDARGVLVSEDDWFSIQETLHLLSVPGMRESIIEGLKTPVEDCTENLGHVVAL